MDNDPVEQAPPFDDAATVDVPEVDPEQKIVHNPTNDPEESEKV